MESQGAMQGAGGESTVHATNDGLLGSWGSIGWNAMVTAMEAEVRSRAHPARSIAIETRTSGIGRQEKDG